MAEQTELQKYHMLSPRNRRIVALLCVLVLLVLIPLFAMLYYKAAINRPAQNDKEITVEIPRGVGVSEIARILFEQNLINSEFLFNLYIKLNQLETSLQAGVYIVPAGTPITELAELLMHGTNDVRITFLEGWRVEELARESTKKFKNVDYEKFITLARPYEGFLFPDTYYFNSEVTEEEIIEELRETFDDKTDDMLTSTRLAKVNLNELGVVTLASIVEREVNTDSDRPVVAGILLNRLRNQEILGADATTQYATALYKFCAPGVSLECFDGRRTCNVPTDITDCITKKGGTFRDRILSINWWPNEITLEDLDFNNEYNTRKVGGVPPTPIANPGLNAIESVLNAQQTEYNFYLTDSEGTTHYAKTLAEHEANIARYLR